MCNWWQRWFSTVKCLPGRQIDVCTSGAIRHVPYSPWDEWNLLISGVFQARRVLSLLLPLERKKYVIPPWTNSWLRPWGTNILRGVSTVHRKFSKRGAPQITPFGFCPKLYSTANQNNSICEFSYCYQNKVKVDLINSIIYKNNRGHAPFLNLQIHIILKYCHGF